MGTDPTPAAPAEVPPPVEPTPVSPLIAPVEPTMPLPAPETPVPQDQPPAASQNGAGPADGRADQRLIGVHQTLGSLQAQLDQIEARQQLDGKTLIAITAMIALLGVMTYVAIKAPAKVAGK